MPSNYSGSCWIKYQFSVWLRRKQNPWEVLTSPKSPSTTERVIIIIIVIFEDFTWAPSYMLSLLSEKLFFKSTLVLSLLSLSALLLSVQKIFFGDMRVVVNDSDSQILCSFQYLHHWECDSKFPPVMRSSLSPLLESWLTFCLASKIKLVGSNVVLLPRTQKGLNAPAQYLGTWGVARGTNLGKHAGEWESSWSRNEPFQCRPS